MKADLHLHSTRSDGSWHRASVLQQAAAVGLTHVAFTEHDDTGYHEEALALAKPLGIRVLRGTELSCADPATGKKAHILAYLYTDPQPIEALAADIRRQRQANCLWQVEVLHSMGYEITPQNVLPYQGGGSLFKQHLLQFLVDSGQTDTVFGTLFHTAFEHGGPCARSIHYPDARTAVAAIREAGGYAVLAHAGQQQNFELIPDLVSAGLAGLELNHPANTAADRALLSQAAAQYGLFCTGGSDFHGDYEAGRDTLGGFVAPADCPLPALCL